LRLLAFHNQSTYAVALTIFLFGYLLFHRQNGFGPAEIDNDITFIHLLHRTGDQVADFLDIFIVNSLAFGFAHFLDKYLFGGSYRISAKLLEGDENLNFVVDLSIGVDLLRILQRNLDVRVDDSFHNRLDRVHVDIAGTTVYVYDYVVAIAVFLSSG
jgi:hypothetical protein